jgi:hypothetical protein
MRLMRMIGMASLGYGAYKAYKNMGGNSMTRRRGSVAMPIDRDKML